MTWFTILFHNGDILQASGPTLEDALAALERRASDVRRYAVDRRPYVTYVDFRARERERAA